jgi:hypothetical protein
MILFVFSQFKIELVDLVCFGNPENDY